MRIHRRHLLAAAAAVTALGAAGAGGLAWSWWDQPSAEGYTWLSADEVAFLDAFAEAVFPPGGDPPVSGREAQVARVLDEVWTGLEPFQRTLLREGLHALDALAVPAGGRLHTLSPEAAGAVIAGWLDSPVAELRGLAQSVHIFVGGAWMLHPSVAAKLTLQFGCGFGA